MIDKMLSWLERRFDIDAEELQKDVRKLGMGLAAAAIAAILLQTPETVGSVALSVIAVLIGITVWFVGFNKKDDDYTNEAH